MGMLLATGALFALLAAWCSRRMHTGAGARGTALVATAMIFAYASMVMARPMSAGTATLALFGFELILGVLGIQGVLALLKAFDPPPATAGDDGDGGAGVTSRGPGGDPSPAALDWQRFDDERSDWATREPPVPQRLG